jgi:hypothetical protein
VRGRNDDEVCGEVCARGELVGDRARRDNGDTAVAASFR